MTSLPHHPMRIGTVFHNGKIYLFRPNSILVASQWPDLRAWRKTPIRPQWYRVRPELILERCEGVICARFVTHRTARIRRVISYHSIKFSLAGGLAVPEMDPYGAQCDAPAYETPGSLCKAEEEEFNGSQVEANRLSNQRWSDDCVELSRMRHGEYISPIPNELLAAILPFQERRWHLLNLVGRCPGAFNLVKSNPALAMAVSSPWAFREVAPQRPLRSARALIGKRQSEIAAWLGFPESRSTVRILAKLPADQCSVYMLRALRRLFATHHKCLQHVPSLNAELIHLLSLERDLYRLSPAFIEEIGVNPISNNWSSDAALIQDLIWMRECLGKTGVVHLRSRDHLRHLHDSCVERMGRPDLRFSVQAPFPEPPLSPVSPNLELEPLRTETELLEEGRVQRNCVGAYGTRVRLGKVYLYRILSPERATLAVALSPSGKWNLQEIKSFDNGPVCETTVAAIFEWIDSAGSMNSYECAEDDVPFRIKR